MENAVPKKKKRQVFDGPIPPEKIAHMAGHHQEKTEIGAHALFLGQVRADGEPGKRVAAIIYDCYEEMAEKVMDAIREESIEKFNLTCVHILHSRGEVKAGELSLLVMTSAPHRRDCLDGMNWAVEEIKQRVPFWKKEIFEDGSERFIEGEGMGFTQEEL